MTFTLSGQEIELLKKIKSTALEGVRVTSCSPEQMSGVDGFRCKALCFGKDPGFVTGIALIDDGELSDVEVLWVREASAYDLKELGSAVPLATLFPLEFEGWPAAAPLEVAVLAAVSPRRRFWAPGQGEAIRHDAGLRLGLSGRGICFVPSEMPFGDFFISATLPSGIDGAFQAV